MTMKKACNLVHVHAEALTHDDLFRGHVQILEPSADDAAAMPRLFEALEAQLWGAWDVPPQTEQAIAGVDADEVLHPVSGIELDA